MTLTTADTTRANEDRSGQGIYPFKDFEQRYRLTEENTEPTDSDSHFAAFGGRTDLGLFSYVDPYSHRRQMLGRTIVYWTVLAPSPLATITSQGRWISPYSFAPRQSGLVFQPDSSNETPNERLMRLHSALASHFAMFEDPLGIRARLQGFRELQDGWADGMQPASEWGQGFGKALDSAGLDWLIREFSFRYRITSPKPYLYPTPEGGVQVEWSLGSHEVSLKIDLHSHMAEWHWLDIDTDEDGAKHLNLDEDQSWTWLQGELRRLEASLD